MNGGSELYCCLSGSVRMLSDMMPIYGMALCAAFLIDWTPFGLTTVLIG